MRRCNVVSLLSFVAPLGFAGLSPAAIAQPKRDPAVGALVPYPQPLITEVFFNVRSGRDGDATGDGDRDPVGDEFIELVNPHDKPIRLTGFTLVDSDAYKKRGASNDAKTAQPNHGNRNDSTKPKHSGDKPGAGASPAGPRDGNEPKARDKTRDRDRSAASDQREVRFTFPDLELRPGQVAVVFNGYKQRIPGSVGDAARASTANENFDDAYVFSMRVASKYAAFDNNGDWVALLDPSGKPVQLVRWGKPAHSEPQGVALVDSAPESDGSVQRESLTGPFRPHDTLKGYDDKLFSPGRFIAPGVGGDPSDAADQPQSEGQRRPKKSRP